MSRRIAFDNTLGLGGGLQVTVLVRETNDAAAVCNVDPLGIRSRRIECDSVRSIEPGSKHLSDCQLGGTRRNPLHAYLVFRAVRYEKIPVLGQHGWPEVAQAPMQRVQPRSPPELAVSLRQA